MRMYKPRKERNLYLFLTVNGLQNKQSVLKKGQQIL